jgi:hypothetical protein
MKYEKFPLPHLRDELKPGMDIPEVVDVLINAIDVYSQFRHINWYLRELVSKLESITSTMYNLSVETGSTELNYLAISLEKVLEAKENSLIDYYSAINILKLYRQWLALNTSSDNKIE